jgi:hypothetical protein
VARECRSYDYAPVQPRSLASLYERFDGVARRDELAQAAVTYHEMECQVAASRWRRLNEAVFALHNGPLTRQQQELAVWLSAPWPAALCAQTGAARLGLRGIEHEVVHLLVPRGGRVLPTPGIRRVIHESRRFDAADVPCRRRPAVVSIERAIVDAAVWSPVPRDGARYVAGAVQQRLTTAELLLDELDRAGKVRNRQFLRRLLADLLGGAQALSEVEFLRFCARHGLPRPELNVRCDATGRRRYLDAVFPLRGGGVVRAEIDGGIHLTLAQRWKDTARDNDYALLGASTLRFPSAAIYADDPEAVRQIRAALGICQTHTRS